MKQPNDATRRQLEAADPDLSTWLSANAGSGKTRVLTDRVARLLLDGVQPQRILCLTYTKAAASEMQNRLFKRLGEWAMLDDDPLRKALDQLGATQSLEEAALRKARTLFARAIETPGGLKIQTIHSFCATLLRRFPLEAGVSPQFSEIEDRAADLLRAQIVDEMAQGPEAEYVRQIARHYTGEDFIGLTQTIVGKRQAFSAPFETALLLAALGQPLDLTAETLFQSLFSPSDWAFIQALVPLLEGSGKKDQETAQALRQITKLDLQALPNLEDAFLTKTARTPKSNFIAKALRRENPALAQQADDLVARVVEAREQRLALACVRQSADLHAFGQNFLARYDDAKTARAWLDFDDLIEKARALLSDSQVAAWVLFRIDGGIDHILVDEAQDTSPSQWDVIRKLAEEFAAGQGARTDIARTLFVVGDQKQSIYSFQGADPKAFDAMRNEFATRLRDSGQALQQTSLDYSFRSSPAILDLVDTVFTDVPGFPSQSRHIAFHNTLPGRVDVWPIQEPTKTKDEGAWFDPVDAKSETHHHRALALTIATEIKRLINDKTPIPTKVTETGDVLARALQPSDILILVRRRSGIFHEIIRACKEAELPIAGADRLRVGAEIAVKDLGALLSFLALPDDDLSLACALRSPLFGWSEDDLFCLAHNRGKQTLWQALRGQKDAFPDTIDTLFDLLNVVDYLRPYDLIERVLTRHSGRKKLLGRLGQEAEDGIDSLLTQALAYERNAIPSLTGFLVWMETDSLEIKRQIDSASNQIRIMTVHGAKGLEAPLVILPECEARRAADLDQVLALEGRAIWRTKSLDQPAAVKSLVSQTQVSREEEALRLLYVALTRAEKWLIVTGSGEVDSKEGTDWHSRVATAAGLRGQAWQSPLGEGTRIEFGDWTGLVAEEDHQEPPETSVLEPFFTSPAQRPESQTRAFSPSSLSGAKALPGEGMAEAQALAYGTLVHSLLERPLDTVPNRDVSAFADHAVLGPDLIQAAMNEAQAVRQQPDLAFLFAPDALAEVPVTAPVGLQRLSGIIDRLVITPDRVLIIDFKTNRVVPDHPSDIPEGLIKQMAAYADAVAQIYPNRAIETAILWTSVSALMSIPHDIVRPWVQNARYLDDAATSA